MTKKILVTGHTGFIGTNLIPDLERRGYSVYSADFDLTNFESVQGLVSKGPWDVVVHLAAISHVVECENKPDFAYQVNTTGVLLLLEALLRQKMTPHFVFASSAQIYAAPEGDELVQGVTMTEERRIRPQNTYARTKRAAEVILQDFCSRNKIGSTTLRLFNHSHKTQPPQFFLPHIYNELKPYRGTGQRVQIPVGNLDVGRDIGALPDVINAISTVVRLERKVGEYAVYNVCSGVAKNLRQLALAMAKRLEVNVDFVVDPARLRPGEPVMVRGSHDLLSFDTEWRPQRSSLDDLLEAFLE